MNQSLYAHMNNKRKMKKKVCIREMKSRKEKKHQGSATTPEVERTKEKEGGSWLVFASAGCEL
jgi:hypothetical protein